MITKNPWQFNPSLNKLMDEPRIKDKIFTVSEFLDFLNTFLKPCQAIVQGEVGERVNNYPGYSFFNILDKKGSILKCFAFKGVFDVLGLELEPGMEIRVIGYPEIRKDRGEFKFQVQRIELIGEGILKKQFEILKKKLATAGYFSPEFKKPLPRFCENIGLITSKYGKGAKKDFLTHLGNFGFQVYFYDVRVEGSLALPEIIEAINWFNKNLPQIDVLVLTRGGGDWQSLQPFNSQELVKAIFASKIPIITGIGHEDDETLADLTADLRASTPTHAARILTENWRLAKEKTYDLEKNFPVFVKEIFKNIRERIKFSEQNLTKNRNRWQERIKKLLKEQEEKLILSSPNLKLRQGYTITVDALGKIIKDIEKLKINQIIKTKFYRGNTLSQIKKIEK